MNEFIQNKIKERISELMESDTIPWYKPWSDVEGAGVNYFTRRKYHGLNRIFLEDGEYATFNQIKEHKAKLKKGAKGKMVICPILKKVTYDDNMNEEDEENSTNTVEQIRGFKFAFVFEISDTDLPSKKTYQKNEFDISKNEDEALKKVNEIIKKLGLNIKEKVSDSAYYSESEDLIVVPKKEQFKSISEYLHTLLHEIGHATGSKKRLNRGIANPFGSPKYAKEELVAEIFSLSALAELRLNNPYNEEQTVAYLKEWKKYCLDNVTNLLSASNLADKALEYCFA